MLDTWWAIIHSHATSKNAFTKRYLNGDLGIDGRKTLEWTLQNCWEYGLESSGSGHRMVAGVLWLRAQNGGCFLWPRLWAGVLWLRAQNGGWFLWPRLWAGVLWLRAQNGGCFLWPRLWIFSLYLDYPVTWKLSSPNKGVSQWTQRIIHYIMRWLHVSAPRVGYLIHLNLN